MGTQESGWTGEEGGSGAGNGRPAGRPGPAAAGVAAAIRRAAEGFTTAFLAFAPAWDAAGYLGLLPPWWPPVSYAMIGAGVLAGCSAVLIRTLQRRRRSTAAGASYGTARGTLLEILAIGLFLAAWILRGDAEIPPDPPLVTAQLIALAALLVAARLRRREA